jgi:hypothetical protein
VIGRVDDRNAAIVHDVRLEPGGSVAKMPR